MIDKYTVQQWLQVIGFNLQDGLVNLWIKKYKNHSDYCIQVNLENTNLTECKIDYGKKITVGRGTILNFSKPENLVVLECVNRLLDKGYKPESIYLEKNWRVGGYLDILIKENTKAYLMIECKQWGNEYESALNIIQNNNYNKEQLFNYYLNEKSTKYLSLYSSTLTNSEINYKNDIINAEAFRECDNQSAIYEIWNKTFSSTGIFEEDVEPYRIQFEITKNNLLHLKFEDGKRIYNQFEEILRRNVVSDKTNAFNKIFNLFLCKIIDEDTKQGNEKMDFQWGDREDNERVLMRLNDLYKTGMKAYLDLSISDLSHEEIEKKIQDISNGTRTRVEETVNEIYTILRLYKNNEFAFKEVFDKKTFDDNCIIVKDVVKILEKFRLKYTSKQQFLGDFFEKLLTTGIKQESGQYFTPVPVTRFICNSIPIKEIIDEKIKNREQHFLPFVIDFACGSGHFITEVMDSINRYLNKIEENKLTQVMRDNLNYYKISYKWARTFIYGIEKDYRLAKTTKVSCFLNGDGDANIICGDGLGNFKLSSDFRDLLKTSNDSKDNQKFDVIIANPPYSVSSIKNCSKDLNLSFDLYSKLTDKSKQIECLFLERTKQLLKEKGCAGIFFPASLLGNKGIYISAREILLKYFEIKSLVEFSAKTFCETDTKTMAFFLKRRDDTEWKRIKNTINSFFDRKTDMACNNIPNIFSKYIKDIYDIDFKEYLNFLNRKINTTLESSEFYKEYKEWFDELTSVKKLKKNKQDIPDDLFYERVIKIEKEKLLYYILSYNQKVIIVRSGKKQKGKEFLGYEVNKRRGYEGVNSIETNKTIDEITKLYNNDNLFDPHKVNSYIYKAFLGEYSKVDNSLKEYIRIENLNRMIEFQSPMFRKKITIEKRYIVADYKQIWDIKKPKTLFVKLGRECNIDKGTTITKKNTKKGNVPVVAGGKEPAYYHNKSNRKGNIVTVSASGIYSGYVNFYKEDIWASDSITVRSKDENRISTKLIYIFLKYLQKEIHSFQTGQGTPHVYKADIENIWIPIPTDASIQNKIIKEIESLENNTNDYLEKAKDIFSKYL